MAGKILTEKRLKELLHYDADTGIFVRKKSVKGRAKNSIAGTIHAGYVCIKIDYQRYRAHRLAWLYVYGAMPEEHIDHINQNKLDNRIINLRKANKSQNNQNKLEQKNNTSGYRGVSFKKANKKWMAKIQINNKTIFLGYFTNKNSAIYVRKQAEIKYFTHHRMDT